MKLITITGRVVVGLCVAPHARAAPTFRAPSTHRADFSDSCSWHRTAWRASMTRVRFKYSKYHTSK